MDSPPPALSDCLSFMLRVTAKSQRRWLSFQSRYPAAAVGGVATVVAFVMSGLMSPVTDAADPNSSDSNTKPAAPKIAEASGEPVESMNSIQLDPGLKIDVVAAEPDIANVVAFDIDDRGRIYVCETFRQGEGVTDNRNHNDKWLEADLASETVQDRIDYHRRLLGDAAVTYAQQQDRIRRLVDTDGDYRIDSTTIVADGFHQLEEGTGAGVLAIGDSVYYTCIPRLWRLTDADDDGVAESQTTLSDGYGVRVAFRGHDSHGLIRGPDGRIYFSIGDRGYHITTPDGRVLADPASGAVFRCEPDGSDLTVVATGMRNPQELAFDDYGDLFSVDNNSDSGDQARVITILPDGDSGWRMNYQYLGDRGIFNREKIWEPLHDAQTVNIVPPIINLTDGPSGLAHYPGTGFGDRFKNQFLICDFRGGPVNSGIRSFTLDHDGAFYKMTSDAQPVWRVLATDVQFAPDGGLYVSDWVDGWNGLGKARMYRIHDPGADQAMVRSVKNTLADDPTDDSVESLVDGLSHVDRRIRYRSQYELADRGELDALTRTAQTSTDDVRPRLHGVWGISQIARGDVDAKPAVAKTLVALMGDADVEVRRAAILATADLGLSDASTVGDVIGAAIGDAAARVQYAAMIAAADLKIAGLADAVAETLDRSAGNDPALRHAAIRYLSRIGEDALLQLSSRIDSDASFEHREFMHRCVAAALRRRSSALITRYLDQPSPIVLDEVIRGIHDDRLSGGYESLIEHAAGWLNRPASVGDESWRRIVNTTDRVRGAAGAKLLAAIAESSDLDESIRLEAIDVLANWTQPRTIDRYDHAHAPRDGGNDADAASALRASLTALSAASPTIRSAAYDAAARLGLKEIIPALVKTVADGSVAAAERASALAAIADMDLAAAGQLAMTIKPTAPAELFRQSLETLSKAASSDEKIALQRNEAVLAAMQSDDLTTAQLAWRLASQIDNDRIDDAIEIGLKQFLAGQSRPGLNLEITDAAQRRLGDSVKATIAAHNAELKQTDSLAEYLVSLEGGDVDRGHQLFHEKTELSCVRCHKVHRAGGNVGPNLTTIGAQKDRRYLLESIVYPNAEIAKGYATIVLATDDGRVVTGIVVGETSDTITLLQNDGTEVSVEVEAIVAERKGVSSMPSDLIKQMTASELRDLVAYLESLKIDPRATGAEIE